MATNSSRFLARLRGESAAADASSAAATPGGPETWGMGRHPAEVVGNILKKWRDGGPAADVPEEQIDFIVKFQFAPKDHPTRWLLEDAVLHQALDIDSQHHANRSRGAGGHAALIEDGRSTTTRPPSTTADHVSSHERAGFDEGQYIECVSRRRSLRHAPLTETTDTSATT